LPSQKATLSSSELEVLLSVENKNESTLQFRAPIDRVRVWRALFLLGHKEVIALPWTKTDELPPVETAPPDWPLGHSGINLEPCDACGPREKWGAGGTLCHGSALLESDLTEVRGPKLFVVVPRILPCLPLPFRRFR
jgi:hypothetical protein